MANKKETITLVAGATVGAILVPYVRAKHERILVPQLPAGLGTASALVGLGGGALLLWAAMKGKVGAKHSDLVTGLGLGLVSTGLAAAALPYVSAGISSGQVRRVSSGQAYGMPTSSLVRVSASV